MKLSKNQISMMKHAVANDPSGESYRNYYNTVVPDQEWDDLVEKGLAMRRWYLSDEMGGVFYYLTGDGLRSLQKVLNK